MYIKDSFKLEKILIIFIFLIEICIIIGCSRDPVLKKQKYFTNGLSYFKEKNNPNPRYLDGVQKCIEIRCKLLGLNDILQNKHPLITKEIKSDCEDQDEFPKILKNLEPLIERVIQDANIS